MTDAISSSSVHTVRETSGSDLNPTGSVQFMFALLQMELAQTNKDAALTKIDGIRIQQEKSADITEAINQLRNLRQGLEEEDDKTSVSGNADWEAACEVMDKYGIEHETDDGKVMRADLDTMIASLEAAQEEVSSDVQQEMVYVQDYMGQYNSYTQGASSAISSANETLKTLARGG